MEVIHVQSVEIITREGSEEDKQKWVEEHARSLQHLFEQWQKPLGINGEEYRKHLAEDLVNYCDRPLLKSFIESIS